MSDIKCPFCGEKLGSSFGYGIELCSCSKIGCKGYELMGTCDMWQELMENIAALHNNKNESLENILNSALQREITTKIGHQPDKDEMRVCVDYIKNYAQTSERVDLTGVCIAITQARKECFKQCEDCGDYYLAKDMNTEYGYCLTCKPHYPDE